MLFVPHYFIFLFSPFKLASGVIKQNKQLHLIIINSNLLCPLPLERILFKKGEKWLPDKMQNVHGMF